MSESAELVRRAVEAWNARDMDAMLALNDPEIEFVNSPSAVEPGTRRGAGEFAEAMRTQWDILHGAHLVLDEVFDHGDLVATLGRFSRGFAESEARIEQSLLLFWTVRGGRIARLEVRIGHDEIAAAIDAAREGRLPG